MPRPIPLDTFDKELGTEIELSSASLGGKIEAKSDDFFAAAENLLKPEPSVSLKGQFGPNGALFDGWESRRHNEAYDWVIVRLGAPLGSVIGFDVDTGHFSGNESPASGVWGAHVADGVSITEDSSLWEPLLPVTPLGPAQRHLFKLDAYSKPITHLKLTMHPDGGIGRFRAYGKVLVAPRPENLLHVPYDLAYVLNGAVVVAESDQHFGKGANIILPGRGVNMGDGWETKRSRGRLGKGLGDWVVVRLGEPGFLNSVVIDTLHFVGNFPQTAEIYATQSSQLFPDTDSWDLIVPSTRCGPHQEHILPVLPQVKNKVYSHVKLCIYPDGGVKRLRVLGTSSRAGAPGVPESEQHIPVKSITPSETTKVQSGYTFKAVPLTPGGFSHFGTAFNATDDLRSVHKSIPVKRVNFGTANKFGFLVDPKYTPPTPERLAELGVSSTLTPRLNACIYRSEQQGGQHSIQLDALERHEFSTQVFVPMGGGHPDDRFLVVVAPSRADGSPDVSGIQAFVASVGQGIAYGVGVWHHPLIALDRTTDFFCLVNETGVDPVDCEIIRGSFQYDVEY